MAYLIEKASTELMLEPEELKEILQAFFEDAPSLIAAGRQAIAVADWSKLARSMHSLKGAAFNLRMEKIGTLAARAEHGDDLSADGLAELMQAMELELRQTKTEIGDCFATNL